MHHANLSMKMQHGLFSDIFATMTLLDGLMVIELNGKHASPHKHIFGETVRFACSLLTVGEAGTVKSRWKPLPCLMTVGFTGCLWGTP